MNTKHGLLDYSGLLFDCPLREQLHDCVFRDIRKLDLKERIEIWKNMCDEERDNFISRHHVCIYERERTQLRWNPITYAEDNLE